MTEYRKKYNLENADKIKANRKNYQTKYNLEHVCSKLYSTRNEAT